MAEPGSQKLQAPPNFDGPVKRKCTDTLFMLVLVCCWIAMTVIGIKAVQTGNPDRLVNGIDYQGRICGVDAGVETLTKMYYIRFDGTGVCVADCPAATDLNTLYTCTTPDAAFAKGGANQLNCEGSDAQQCADLTGVTDPATFSGGGDGACMYQIESVDVLNHCLFTDPAIADAFVSLNSQMSYMQQFLADIYTARNWILGFGFGFSLVMGFVYCLLLRVPGVVAIMTWGSILAVIALFAAVGYGLYTKGDEWAADTTNQHTDVQITIARIFGIAGYVLAGLFACLALFMCRRIRLATSIMKEAARAIGKIPAMILMPVVEAVGLVLFFVPLVFYGVYVASMGDFSTTTVAGLEVKTVTYGSEVQGMGWYLLFCLFWTTQFIIAMGQIVVALAVVKYFFTRDKSTLGSGTFFKAMKDGMWYHMGTAAFGSLIIAIIQMIRAIIAWFQKKAKASGNKIAQYALCCCQCCFWCLQKCMQFINKNAYIQTALFSTGFCKSGKEAFFLIARNIARVGAVSMVSEFMIIIMKLVICLATMAATYLGLDATIGNELHSFVGPTIFVGVLAYLVASVFAELFSMTTATILQCFIADEEMYSPAERYADNDLKDFVNTHGAPKRLRKGSPAELPHPVALNGTGGGKHTAVSGTA
eukprot:TRINITY_DN5798_c0_g2_i1.p1 TRINITY_DN5798_c0_g2~~TRINITY_DN5798_c0_g2_i1.p1  ORF type:complete len:646 (-),score=224.01 TRINITY_DN5798_c0_g2_i1:303-2240(-)